MSNVLYDLSVKIGTDLSGFYSGLNKAKSGISSFGSAVGKGLGTIAKVGAAAVGAATSAVGAFATASVKSGMDFDASMSQVAATMGVTTDEINNLREFAMEMGRTTVFSASQAADALNYMALAGYNDEQAMKMLPNVLNLAAAGGMELATASDMVTDAQTALGLSIDETTSMVDKMAVTASTTNTSVSQLGEAILTIGGTAKFMKGGVTEISQVLGLLADNGIKGSEAGTHLRNMLLKLSSPTKEGSALLGQFADQLGHNLVFDEKTGEMRAFKDIFQDLNTVMGDMTDEAKIQAFSELFNSRDVASATALLDTNAKRWDEVQEKINKASEAGVLYNGQMYTMEEAQAKFGDALKYASDQFQVMSASERMAYEQNNNLAGSTKMFKSALEGAQIALSDTLKGPLNDIVKFGTESLSSMTDAFKKDGITGLMSALGDSLTKGTEMLVNMIADFIPIGGQLLGAIGKGIMDNLPVITTALTDLINMMVEAISSGSSDFLRGALDIITAIGNGLIENIPTLLSTALLLITQFVQFLVDAIPEHSGDLMGLLTTIGNIILENVSVLMTVASELIQNLAAFLLEFIPTAIPYIVAFVTSLGQMIIDNLPVFLTAAFEITMALLQGLLEALPTALPMIVEFLLGIVNFITDNIQTVVEVAIQIVQALADGLIQALPVLLPAIIDMVIAIVTALTEPTSLMQLMNAAVLLAMAILEGLMDAIPQLLAAVPEIIANLVGALIAAVPEILAAAVYLFNGLIEGLIEIEGELFLLLPSLIMGFVDGIKEGIGAIVECGKELIEGLWKGITDRWTGLVEGISELAGGIIDTFKDLFGIHSPSTVFAGLGDNIVAGLSNGISQNDAEAIKQMTEMANGMGKAFESIDVKIKSTIDNVINSVTAFAKSLYDLLDENSKQIIQNIAQALTQLISKMVQGATSAVNGFINIWKTLVGKVQSVLTDIIGKVVAFVSDLASKAGEAAKGFVDAITDGVKNLPEQFTTIGKNIVDGIWKGLQEGWTWLTEKVGKLAQELLDKAKNALGVHSPSTKFEYVGRMVDEGFAKGINDYIGMIDNAARNIESAVEIRPVVGGTQAGGIVNNTINIYPSRGMDEKALAKEIGYQLSTQDARTKVTQQNTRTKATWRLANA